MKLYHIVSFLFIALAVPLILKKVPPNYFYGFRTPKTMSDEKIWYRANTVAGWDLLAAGIVLLVVSIMQGRLDPKVLLGAVAVGVFHSFWALRKM